MPTLPASPDNAATAESTGTTRPPEEPGTRSAATPRGRFRGFRALRAPGFRIYFAGMLVRGLAMWMPLVAIPWLAVELGASAAEIGLVTGAFYLPTLFVGPLGGVMADRVDRRNVLVGAQLFAALLAGVVALLVSLDLQTLPIVGAASFGLGLVIAVEVPVRQAYMTELVPVRDVSSAASLHATAWNTTRLVGPVVAGVMIATVGPASPFVFAGLASLVVSLSFFWMDLYRERGRQRHDRSHPILADLRAGTSFAVGEPAVRWCLLLILAAGTLGTATFSTLAPIYARDELGVGAEGYGAFLGAAGAGALGAALLVTTFAHGDRRPWLIAGVLGIAGLVGGIALAQAPGVVFGLAFLLGAAQITLAQNALVSVHGATPDALRGRVMGLWVTIFQGSGLLGSLLSGWLADVLGVRSAMLVAALLLSGFGLVALVAIRRVTWRLTPAGAAA